MISAAGLTLIQYGCYFTAGVTVHAAYKRINISGLQENEDRKASPFLSKIIRTLSIASIAFRGLSLFSMGYGILPQIAFVASLHQAALGTLPFAIGCSLLHAAALALRNYIRPSTIQWA